MLDMTAVSVCEQIHNTILGINDFFVSAQGIGQTADCRLLSGLNSIPTRVRRPGKAGRLNVSVSITNKPPVTRYIA